MIGQTTLIEKIKSLSGQFPRFSIIVGETGSGKKTISKYIAERVGALYIECNTKIETVRNVIDTSYKVEQPTLYCFSDAYKMSTQAKNALLKLTEEPPRKAAFILTCEDEGQLLSTLKTRGQIFRMDGYTEKEIVEYYYLTDSKNTAYVDDGSISSTIQKLCTVPGDVNIILEYDVLEFYDFLEMVAEIIGITEPANAMKLSTKIKLKEEDKGYDLKFFLKAFNRVCRYKYYEAKWENVWLDWIRVTSRYIDELSISGINKVMLLDEWILAIRQEYLK